VEKKPCVEDVWNAITGKWVPYTGKGSLKQTIFGAPATKEEAENYRVPPP
jgi:hypothetical protein